MGCAHENCHCQSEVGVTSSDGERFCSDYCEQAARSDSDASCQCGHAGCSTSEEESVPGAL